MVEQEALALADAGEVEASVDTLSGSVSFHSPFSQYRPRAVISRMLISGLKLVANALPCEPPLQSTMST